MEFVGDIFLGNGLFDLSAQAADRQKK
jgi:hypothetical protein